MSEDARKECRTQGKYSERNQNYDDKRIYKRQDKRQKGSPTVKEPQEKKFHKRKSNEGKASNTSLTSENESPLRYEKNSAHTFSQLEDVKKPVELKNPGKHILSNTENGESVVFYNPNFLEEEDAFFYKKLLHHTTNWYEKNIIIQGIEYPQPRLVAWYGPFPYTYSGATLEPAEMPDCILEIKKRVEDYLNKNGLNVKLNSVLLNLYRNNKDSVAWHSDDEFSMGVCPTIASVSLGATRKFEMRRKITEAADVSSVVKGEECFIHLANGSLLIMDGCMQKDWQHRVPKEYHDRGVRINLTFRTVYRLEDLPTSPGTYPKNHPCNDVLKKSSTRKTNCHINYDDENFPPLTNDTSPVCSDVKKSATSGASMIVKSSKFNGSNKWRKNGTSSCSETSLKISSEINHSNDFWDVEQCPSDKTGLKVDEEIHSSGKILSDELSQNTFSSKIHETITSGNDHCTESFNNNGSWKDGKMCESEGVWDSESSPCDNNFLKNDAILNRSKVQQVFEPFCIETSAFLNNLNEDKKNVKIDMQNKNLCAYDSNFSSSNVVNAAGNAGKDKNFQAKESYNDSTNPVINMHENAQKVNKPTSGKNKTCTLNAEAKEFVPLFQKSTISENSPYIAFELENLLDYNVDLMDSNAIKNYAIALKAKVFERITEFSQCHEELEVLCQLTDGDQTEKNQKIISSRMSFIVRRALRHQTSPNFRKPYGGNPIKLNHGNQNHFSGKRYPRNIRERSNIN